MLRDLTPPAGVGASVQINQELGVQHRQIQSPHTSVGLKVEELRVGTSTDPAQDPALKALILAKMGLAQNSTIQLLAGNCGGLNEGVWIVRDGASQSKFILKLVKSRRNYGPSDAERLIRISKQYPAIMSDPTIASALLILSCVGPTGDHSHDFIVMRKVPGEPVGDIIALQWNAGHVSEVMQMLRQVGAFLAQFHKRYNNSQHNDFQPSNVFYDAPSGRFTLIDIADLGDNSCNSGKGDLVHFAHSLKLLSGAYGERFYSEGKRSLEEGYKMGA
jgi:serine/threonine protein kinase